MDPIQDLADRLGLALPSHLTRGEHAALAKALTGFPINRWYYSTIPTTPELLQGDIWTGLPVLRPDTGETRPVCGILLSNTCDIAQENPREWAYQILFAPIIPLSDFVELLEKNGVEPDRLGSIVRSVKNQETTTILFVPGIAGSFDESICFLDRIHYCSVETFFSVTTRQRKARLNQFGHYVLLYKIAVHFCRFNEGLHRNAPVEN